MTHSVFILTTYRENILLALKICIVSEDKPQEVAVSHHFRSIDTEHPGKAYLRVALEDFRVEGPHGLHQCLVFPALGLSLTNLRDLFEDRALEKTLLQKFLLVIVTAMDFMHQAGVVHTGSLSKPVCRSTSADIQRDLSPNNILVGADDATVSKVEQAELANPSPRKVLTDRTIHLSYAMPTTYEPPVITDFGAARLGDPGQKYSGDVMPGVFRAPEIIAGMEWDSKIDIWSLGMTVRSRPGLDPNQLLTWLI